MLGTAAAVKTACVAFDALFGQFSFALEYTFFFLLFGLVTSLMSVEIPLLV